ncbi:class I SAM-dependent methyltransferase [Nodosilinea sp. FACHB-13]|uniref:class I SAM-dependent methyltransferase n=1 Tax=Cyanophyceae TaxID=3028117 RepID=UPI0016881E08|nr:class I SAM-dependent methyltransferase [Nodosilinea sp. FACHB-13]MBD2109757.1 class I SAM-dependent methyltransferase [Nodosilinea sp. FACHB-13]
MRSCWCGSAEFSAFSPDYSECKICKTLVLQNSLPDNYLIVKNDETDFYGKQYWLGHQNRDFGYPDVYERARNDLTERNLHWFKALMKYCLPPADILELGCGHGSFVALLQQAGYKASGAEMSPWVVSFGRDTFQIPMYLGPVEGLDIPSNSLDVIALMDVLEHLPDPVATLCHCVDLLKPGGFLIIQTPEFQEGMSYPLLEESKSPFLEQLKVDEHLYLFNQKSVTKCLEQVGLKYVCFEPAIFAAYDMFLIASKEPLVTHSSDAIENALLAHPYSRLTLALLDLRERELALVEALKESEKDRAERLDQVTILTQKLKESEIDREARLDQIDALTRWLKEERGEI